mgnify:CR=1 FL=1
MMATPSLIAILFAKNAGCKYINLTTRHHDGFSLFDTCGLNEYDAPHSAAKRDLIKEIRFDCSLNLFEDEVFTCQALQNCGRIGVVNKLIYNYIMIYKVEKKYNLLYNYKW